MANLVVTYTPDGNIKKVLTYKGEKFSYTMIPDEFGKSSDNKVFEMQVKETFPDEPDEVLEALEVLDFADNEEEIEESLVTLSEFE